MVLVEINSNQRVSAYNKYIIKDFYVKEVNNYDLYTLTLGGGMFGYSVVAETGWAEFDTSKGLYKLKFFTKIVNAIDDLPSELVNCLFFHLIQWQEFTVKASRRGTPVSIPVVMEYYDPIQYPMINGKSKMHTYLKYKSNNSENVLEIDPSGTSGTLYLSDGTDTEDYVIFGGGKEVPTDLEYIRKYTGDTPETPASQ
jgi:hypothetical protein